MNFKIVRRISGNY